MPPLTKFWLTKVKDRASLSDQTFLGLLRDATSFCASYTNPNNDPSTPTMHAFYRVVNTKGSGSSPSDLLLMVSGYPSQELNEEVHNVYMPEYGARMFEYVEHVSLRQVELVSSELPLAEKVVISCTTGGSEGRKDGQVGGWDIWEQTPEERAIISAQGGRKDGIDGERVWVGVEPWLDTEETLGSGQEVFYCEMIARG
ncbi:hypothetical protein ASPCAL06026 [Aspergillus calidoustus]|uniref:Uncharacterized protein n=1 Tax=Aspergillus calidoustus TaxID=454130 RepID=A0A0U5FZW8_ASPCI|nr:hypothetical protein ASPCAL06026 [Aspergillus calidoustus]